MVLYIIVLVKVKSKIKSPLPSRTHTKSMTTKSVFPGPYSRTVWDYNQQSKDWSLTTRGAQTQLHTAQFSLTSYRHVPWSRD
jgi:hypothetical protein